MVITSQSVGKALVHGRVLALLPQRDYDQLVPHGTANEDQSESLQVPDQDGPPLTVLGTAGSPGAGDPRGDLRLFIQAAPNSLPKPLRGMIGYGDQQRL